jgi:tRNA threonylcarbamoyladenosine modification (KEOPS) complex  Pcc1 subunit
LTKAPHRAELTFDCGSPATAILLERTLRAEATEGPEGSSVRMTVEASQVIAHVEGEDLATLRAAVNSVARLADTALRTFAA